MKVTNLTCILGGQPATGNSFGEENGNENLYSGSSVLQNHSHREKRHECLSGSRYTHSSGAATSAHRSLKSARSTDASRVGKMQRCRRAQRLDPLRFHFQLVWLRSNWLKGLRWHIHSVQIYFSPRSHVRSRRCCVHGRGVGAWGSTRDFTAERSKSFRRCPATATEGEL